MSSTVEIQNAKEGLDLSGSRVLVVDDEPVIHSAIEALLDTAIDSAMTVAEALAFDRFDEIELVLVDKNLPDGSGLDVVRTLKKRRPELEFLIITGYPSLQSAIEAVETGAFDYLPKPFEAEEFLLKVRNGVEKTRLTREQELLHLELVESEDRHRAVFEASSDAIVVVDKKAGVVLAANRATEKLYGYSASELIGMSEVLLLADEASEGQGRTTHLDKSGMEFPVELTISETMFAGREALVKVIRNVSEYVKAEEERRIVQKRLAKSQKMDVLGQLSAGIAHDFNNLLMIFMGVSSELEFYFEDPSESTMQEAKDVAQELDVAIKSASTLTRQLLGFSRRQMVQIENLDIGATIRSMMQLLRRTVEGRVELVTVIEEDVPVVAMDRGQLEQLLSNLVLNARDAMPQGGNVTVRAHGERDDSGEPVLVLSVSDTGVGIEREVLQQIFEPFFTTKGPERGTGLGLATVQSIVNSYQGAISVESKLAEGTRFVVRLPATSDSPGVNEPDLDSSTNTIPNTTIEILLVEDDGRVRRSLQRTLLRAGYRVSTAESGEEALSLAKNKSFGLLLADIGLPQMQGDELGRSFQESNQGAKVLLMSGYAIDSKTMLSDKAGPLAFIAKPFDEAELLRRVRGILG